MIKKLHHKPLIEIENEYNTYTYLKVPLTLGYEFDFKYLSLELNAGVEYGHLINSSGVEVKRGNVVNDPVPVYFYSDKYIGMMSRKSESLNKHQIVSIEKHCEIMHSSLDTIEACGGGSARCMMAEVFLPKSN